MTSDARLVGCSAIPGGCADYPRRETVRRSGTLNGIDFVEVDPDDPKRLVVTFLHKLGKAPGVRTVDVTVHRADEPGDPIRVLGVERCGDPNPGRDDCISVTLACAVGASCYRLCFADSIPDPDGRPRRWLDPPFACVDFRGDAGGPVSVDPCRAITPGEPREPTVLVDYLARDYGTIRRALLDRLAVTMPGWREGHVPDLWITLVEALAFIGDRKHYALDSVATEAYLGTARRRISIRRHARLVDYRLDEGSNARAWIVVETDRDLSFRTREVRFITDSPLLPPSVRPYIEADLAAVPAGAFETFEPVTGDDRPLDLLRIRNRIAIHTWGRDEFCLPRGATAATLVGDRALAATLRAGSVVMFEEVAGVRTGVPADARPSHRHAVRLTSDARSTVDDLDGTALIEIGWGREDRLPFDVCVSIIGPAPDCVPIHGISVVHGNVVLVDHGRTGSGEVVGRVGRAVEPGVCGCDGCQSCGTVSEDRPAAFAPDLPPEPLVFAAAAPRPLSPATPPAGRNDTLPEIDLISFAFVDADPASNGPGVPTEAPVAPSTEAVAGGLGAARIEYLIDLADRLASSREQTDARIGDEDWGRWLHDPVLRRQLPPDLGGPGDGGEHPPSADDLNDLEGILRRVVRRWKPRSDLLASGPADDHFVIECDDDRQPHIRFGDGDLGRAPAAGLVFIARRRIGNALAGNVGADAIRHVVFGATVLDGVRITARNPLPATGGRAPETLAHARAQAPFAFARRQERAITSDDYAVLSRRESPAPLQAAGATLEWMGSWFEASVVIDEEHVTDPEPGLAEAIASRLEDLRRLGHDVAVAPAQPVPIALGLEVCVADGMFPGDVETRLRDAFGTGWLGSGRRAFFHPDELAPGTPVRLSRIVAAALEVPGVTRADVVVLGRVGRPPGGELQAGILEIGPREVARIDDAGRAGRGVLEIRVLNP